MVLEDEGLIILHNEFGSTSGILTIFARNHGLVKTLAKGSRAKKNAHIYEIGNLVEFEIYKRLEAQLGTIACSVSKSYGSLSMCNSRINRLITICVCEVLNCLLLEGCPNQNFFYETVNLLENPSLENYLHWETTLINELGIGFFEAKSLIKNLEIIMQFCPENKRELLFNRKLLKNT
jgi:DNA repair protein RecO